MECKSVSGECTRCATSKGLVGGRCLDCKDDSCLTCNGSPAKCTE